VPGSTTQTIRDALGLVRLLYATRATREPEGELEGLASVGRELRVALDLSRYEEGSLGHKASLDRADRALDALGRQVAGGPLVDLVRGAQARLRKGNAPASRSPRPATS
jgi:hypothetical protein